MPMIFIDGDLTKFTGAELVCHQCNATSNRSFGLSSSMFKAYPYANIYSGKLKVVARSPGTIIARTSQGKQTIVNMIAQVNPGKPSKHDYDNYEARVEYFGQCLDAIDREFPNVKTIAMPYGIGCGLAGGDWKLYANLISMWCGIRRPELTVYIVKYTE